MAREPISVLPQGFDEAFASLSNEDSEPAAAQSGSDTAESGEGENTAPAGEDTAAAGEGEDTVAAGEGEDTAAAGEGEDTAPAGEDTAAAGEGEDTTTAGEEPAEGQEAQPGQQDQQGEKGDEDPIERLARLLAQSDEQAGSQTQQQQQEPQQQTPEPEPEIYTDEEKQILENYQQEWPEVAQAEELRRRGEYQELVRHIFSEISQQVAPMADMVRALSERTHVEDLRQEVGEDYSDLRDEVVEWVQTQPAYLQGAYQHVIEKGTVDEVADLINRFKAETGRDKQQQTAAPAPPPKKEAELPVQTKKAAASLAPVSSKRTAVPKGEDPTDFDSAFDQFAGKT